MSKKIRKVKGVRNEFLKLVSGGERLIIDVVDGTETLAKAKDLFSEIDSDFITYGADDKGPLTKETAVAVYEMVRDATLLQIFGSLSSDPNKLCFTCLTQAQIKNFVKKYRNWLCADGTTFFPFKSRNNFFVAFVRFYSDGSLKVEAHRFEYSGVWRTEYRHRLVVPQLA